MVETLWYIRDKSFDFDPVDVYGNSVNIFSLKINHGGVFIQHPMRKYVDGKVDYADFVDSDVFSVFELSDIIHQIGYPKDQLMFYHFVIPGMDLNTGLRPLKNDEDTMLLLQNVPRFRVIEVFTEQWSSRLKVGYHLDSTVMNPVVVIEDDYKSAENENLCGNEDEVDRFEDNDNISCENEENDERLEDNDHIFEDVNVDMVSFKNNIEDDHDKHEDEEDGIEEEDDLGIDIDDFENYSEDDDVNVLDLAVMKNRKKRKLSTNLEDPFYVGQSFTNKEQIKNMVKLHAVHTRRELHFLRNEKYRFRVVCYGINPVFVSSGGSSKDGGSQSKCAQGATTAPSSKKYRLTPTCPWALHLSRKEDTDEWLVKTFHNEHKCLQTRKVRLYTVSSIAKEIEVIVESNPEIPLKALQDQLQKKHQVEVALHKIFRAKVMAINKVHGDYAAQYLLLRDYCEEVMISNPGTTVKLDVESEPNAASETRKFRRIYICYGALKHGFKLSGREILGLDGCFMKGPYPGQILTAVGVDANNGIYPLAFAVVEAECTSSWTWFLENLGNDLDLTINSNFTFISDRQKGIIPAINKLFPVAEHRYCLRHIHENMKCKWRGNLYRDMLWNAATATTIPQFNRQMEEIKKGNAALHKWLEQIPPKHWARSHFSGRSKCDVLLNNLCEVFNKQLVGGRDKPIISCLEYTREYMMRRITVVNKLITKCDGPLTPTATKLFNQIKNDASQYIVQFNGKNKYQVSGPWNDQCVMNMETRSCSCRKWELTGMPCKHAVAVNWDMMRNGLQVGLPESWVDEVYWIDTWKNVYKHTVDPINSKELWTPSTCPTTLLPPKHHVQIGRPKKLRKKSAEEISQRIQKDGKLTREGASVTCGICKGKGHNRRRCTGQGNSQNASQTSQPNTNVE